MYNKYFYLQTPKTFLQVETNKVLNKPVFEDRHLVVRGPFFRSSKSAYYGIKFQLKMTVKIINMMIILMFDDDNAPKSSTIMTLWSKYTSFKNYYLVKKEDQTNRAGDDPPIPPPPPKRAMPA